MTVQNQAVSSSNGQLYTWVTASPDWAGSSFPGPGTALHPAIAMAPATPGSGGGVTDHGALTGLNDTADHSWAELAQRPLSAYTAASNDAVLLDARKCITTNRGSSIALRIRLQTTIAWLDETLLGGINLGAGTLTLTAEGGVTLNGSVTVAQNGWWWAKRTALNVWQVFTGGSGGVGGGDFKADGTVPMTADLNHGGFKGTNAAAAVAGTDLTTLSQVQALIAAVDWKNSVKAATTAALAASTRVGNVRTANANGAFPTVDGVTVSLTDAILDKDHATGADRGVWTLTDAGSAGTPWVLTRRSDFDADAEVTTGATVFVDQGTVNGGKFFFLSTTGTITLNTTSLTFNRLDTLPAGSTAGQLLTWSGSVWAAGGKAIIAPAVETSGSPRALALTGAAHTTLAASTEAPSVLLDLSATVQFATGALTAQRAVKITAPTYAFVGASTLSDAATLAISGPPVAGTNATITRSYALWIESGRARFDGGTSFGAATATTGDVRVGTSWSTFCTNGSSDHKLIAWENSNTRIEIGANDSVATTAVWLNSANIQLRVGTNSVFQASSTIITIQVANFQFDPTNSIISIVTGSGGGATGSDLTTRPQNMSGSASVGGKRIDHGGDATGPGGTGGDNDRRGGDANGASGTRTGGNIYDRPGVGTTTTGNWGWGVLSTDAVNFQSMQGGVYYKNAVAVPAGNPSGGGFLYSEAGALKWRGSGGTITTLGAA